MRRVEDIAALPAAGIADRVCRALLEKGRAVVTAPPGAGKSTLLPIAVMDALPPGSKVLMLEPRRLAAQEIARRMAWLLDEPLGRTAGYRIRFDRKVSADTRIEVLTEGILTRRLIDDPGLEGVGAVIFDEFHERSLTGDIALALTRQVQSVLRPDLKILLMSATLDAGPLCRELDAPLVESSGKLFPVTLLRAPETTPGECADAVARTVRQAHRDHEGDILAFLPGEAEIRRCAQLLGSSLGDTHVCPLYGQLPHQAQQEAIAPSRNGERKVVLATPVAETSLTIEGVRIVVDGGFCRKPVYDAQSALSRLETVRISRDMADQRAGRAGRVAPGVCYRLWSEATEARMAPVRTPEILEADLCQAVLDLAAWGESRPERLRWMTPPPESAVRQAREVLRSLDAVDEDGRITPEGRTLSALPCHPRIARMLVGAEISERKALAADIAALLEEKDPLGVEESGLDLRVDALREARRSGREGKWSRLLKTARAYTDLLRVQPAADKADPYEIGALVASAFPERVGKAWKEGAGRFQLASGEIAAVPQGDPLSGSAYLAAANLNARPGGVGRIFLAAPVDPKDLELLASLRDTIGWDSRTGSAYARREKRLGNLLLEARPLSEGVREAMTRAICEAARKEGTSMLDFSPEVQNLQRRVGAVAAWHPELNLPDLSTEAVLDRAPEWLPAWVGTASSVAQLKKIDLVQALWGLLSYSQQQAVDRLAPTHITVPTGSRIRLEYRQGADVPVLRVRLQECFGLTDTPRVNGGALPVLMELLSPGYKSVQLTTDLRSFWSGTYFEVRSELRRRYPRHDWPDDPLSADPVRGPRKR